MLTDEQREMLPVRASIQGELAGFVIKGAIAGDLDIAREVLYLATELADALLALKEARKVLREMEWNYGFCSMYCKARKGEKHEADCKLGKVLGEVEG